jgi:chemotaxis protein methyltransferase CheR
MELRRADIEALGALLNERAGLKLAADGEFGLALAMKGRMQTLSLDHSAAYLSYVRGPDKDAELHRLLPLVTIGKTDFFRDEKQFAALAGKLMPEALARARTEHRALKIWSAACATGEEPYSLAMCCVEAGALVSEVELRATDINGEAVFEAERGVYSVRQLRPVSSERVRRFFISEGRDAAKVTSEVRRMVRFEVGNLAELAPGLRGGHDLIFCRNVMIYFDAATMVRTLDRLYDLLLPGGHLALGYSESLYRVYTRFELTEIAGAFFYRKPTGEPRPAPSMVRPPTPPMMNRLAVGQPRITAAFPALPADPSSRPRTQPLPPRIQPPVATPPVEVSPQAPHRLARSAELIDRGQFLEALDLLRALCQSEPSSLTGWISMGNLLTVLRRFPEAFSAYERALQVEPLSAEARLFSGVALVEANRPREAMEELSKALFLDGELALAHYYLGRAAESVGDGAAARRAYRNCLGICQSGHPGRPYVAHYPDLPKDPEVLGRASQYALSAVK